MYKPVWKSYTFGFLELKGDDWAKVAWNILVREIVGRESTEWSVRYVSNMLAISRVLAITRDPNHFQLKQPKSISKFQTRSFVHVITYLFFIFICFRLDVFLQLSRHIGRQIVGIIIWFG